VEEKPPQQKPKGTAFFGTRGLVKTFSSADRRLADRQLILGIQIRRLSVYMLLAPPVESFGSIQENGLRCFQLAGSSAFRFLNHL
jgi:hypothetical protein